MKTTTFIFLMAIVLGCQPSNDQPTPCPCEITQYKSTDGVHWLYSGMDPRSGQVYGCELDGMEQFWGNPEGTISYKNHFKCN